MLNKTQHASRIFGASLSRRCCIKECFYMIHASVSKSVFPQTVLFYTLNVVEI